MDKLIVFKSTGEVRRVRVGEWWLSSGGCLNQVTSIKITMDYHPIYTRHEIDATPEVLKALGMEE